MRSFLILLACSLQLLSGITVELLAEPASPELKKEMIKAYAAFEKLQTYLISQERFSAKENEQDIQSQIDSLADSFSSVLHEKIALNDQPGFGETVSVVTERITSASRRFAEGRKGYALWELKTIGNYCVSCHTTFSSKNEFSGSTANLSGLTLREQAEFFLATRQFDKAADLFKAVVMKSSNLRDRMSGLRKWLVIHIRVYQDPAAAIVELDTMLRAVSFSSFERKEIQGYRESLLRWKNEPGSKVASLRRAENLLRQSLSMHDLLDAQESTVELLRATALLHRLLEEEPENRNPDRGRILYLLGLSYSKMPLYFVNELPEFFLELCVRENPGQTVARKCYRLLANNTYLDFTGSGGTSIPDDVQEYLDRLYAIAYRN